MINNQAVIEIAALKSYDPGIKAKLWPLMFPYSMGCFSKLESKSDFAWYLKMRLLNLDSRWRRNHEYTFYYYDLKIRDICMYQGLKVRLDDKPDIPQDAKEALHFHEQRESGYSKTKFFGDTI